MNECEHISVGTCKILSKDKSDSFRSGSLIVQGGIGCGENLHVKQSIFCNDIGNNQNIISFKNEDYVKFYNNIIPNNNQISLGNNKEVWNSVFSRNIIFKNSLIGNNVNIQNINVDSNCLLGSNSILLKRGIEECLLNIDSRKCNITFKSPNVLFQNFETKDNLMDINNNSIDINTILNLRNDEETVISFNPKERRALINGELFVSTMIKAFRKINICESKEIKTDSDINLLKVDSDVDISIKISDENISVGTIRKIVIYSNPNQVNINIENITNLKDLNTGIEILFDGKKWILIGKF